MMHDAGERQIKAGARLGTARKAARADLRVNGAEAGDHVVGGVHLGLLAGGGREHDGVGVVPGADGEGPGEVGGGLRGVAGAVAPAGAHDALPDVGRYHPHLRDLRQVLPGEAPLRAELRVAVAVAGAQRGVAARLRVAPHRSSGRRHSCSGPAHPEDRTHVKQVDYR